MAITYTLAGLVAQIEDDLARSDLNTQVRTAIETTVNNLKVKRFWFNETRTATFVTVADQSTYTSSDDTDIPLMLTLDGLTLEDSDGNRFDLGEPIDPVKMHILLGTGSATGQPVEYTYFDQSFVFYPIPDAVYTITPIGHIEVAMPTGDDTADNVWMTKAFELIRSEAKAYLYTHTIKNAPDKAAAMVDAAQGAENSLNRATSLRRASGRIRPTSW